MKKAQSSMEFFVFAGLAMLTVLVFTTFVLSEVKTYAITKEFNLLKDVGLKIQKEIAIAASVEDGYSRKFEIPQLLQATLNYSVTTTNNTITIASDISVFEAAIPPVNGSIIKGENTIEKEDGALYVNR